MSHVFMSYKREDELRVGRLAQALSSEGIEVWWDRGLPGGESWHANIEAKLAQAGCVIVVWSATSAGADGGYVREEARRGLGRGLLVPVLIDPLPELPLGFGEIQAIDLTRWRGERADPFFRDLVATVRAKLAREPLPAATGPALRVRRRLFWGGLSGAGLLSAALFAFNTFGLASSVCTMPGPQPGLSDSCGAMGLGGRPNRTEREAWEAKPAGSCVALRAHVARFPEGAFRRQAADLLTARRSQVRETWNPVTKPLSLFETASGGGGRDESSARADALGHAQAAAERLCRNFGAGTLYRFRAATPVADQWNCGRGAAGPVCGFEGHADCELDERGSVETETCG